MVQGERAAPPQGPLPFAFSRYVTSQNTGRILVIYIRFEHRKNFRVDVAYGLRAVHQGDMLIIVERGVFRH
jgi:hypothetical protein